MEGNQWEFNFYSNLNFDDDDDINEIEPFLNTLLPEEKTFGLGFLGIDFFDDSELPKNNMNGGQILEKIEKFENNYNKIIQSNIIESPTTNLQDKISENFESNLLIAEGTLPGLLISLMFKENSPVSENFLLMNIFHKFSDLRKLNGAKYSGDINKVLKSTLRSSGIFCKASDGKFYFKEKEALDYIIRVTEKVLTKKLEKEKKVSQSSSTKSSNSVRKKKSFSFTGQFNYKICKVYKILDDLLVKYRENMRIDKHIDESFQNINSCFDLLQKIGDQNTLVGILMCFKFFKIIINKFLKGKKKKLESFIDVNKLNDKLDKLSCKMEYLEKNFMQAKSGL